MEGKKLRSRILYICFLSICLSLFINVLSSSKVYSQEKGKEKKVLYISSYNQNYSSVPEQLEGLKSIFSLYNITIDMEFMDTKRFETKRSDKLFYDIIKYKIDRLKPYDAIVVADDSALQFAMDYQDKLFKDLPIVFLGINDVTRGKKADSNKNITGILEEVSITDNIKIALKFNKDATKVLAIVDNTLTGIGDKKQFYLNETIFEQLTFDHIDTSKYTLEELEDLCENIKKDTIVLYLCMNTLKNGEPLTIEEGATIISDHTKVPVYRAAVGGIGYGIIGGKMISESDAGKYAARMVVNIINGEPVENIAMVSKTPTRYIFDYKVIKKYKIDKELVPYYATLVNNELSFYEENKAIVLTTLGVLLIFFLLSIILVYDNRKQKKIEKQLTQSHEKLAQTYEQLEKSEDGLRNQYVKVQEHAQLIEKINQKFEIAMDGTNSVMWELNCKTNKITMLGEVEQIINRKLDFQEDIIVLLNQIFARDDIIRLTKEYEEYKKSIKGGKNYEYVNLDQSNEQDFITLENKNEINIQIPVMSEDEDTIWLFIRGRGKLNSKGELDLIYGIVIDITKIKKQEKRIEKLATHDYLTKLPNRRVLMEKLKEEVSKKKSGAIVIIDLDDFKNINDILGHAYGDLMLQEIAKRLQNISDDKLFVSRFGGDEFLILLSGIEDKYEIKSYIYKIRNIFKEPILVKESKMYNNFSMGISCFPEDSNNADELIMYADTAMYQVKNAGKNSFMFYHYDMKNELTDRIEIETILREALKYEGFTMFYQPQVDVVTGEIIGFEALIRLVNHNISPLKFITIAEETGLILLIGRWVTLEVVKQIAKWRDMGLELKPVAINFSSKQIKDKDFSSYLEYILRENGVESKYIEIEITESILVSNTKNTLALLNKLKGIGVKLALDDFGTGFSSLSYLTFLPVDKIKIDKSLSNKFLGLDNVETMDSLISFAHSLDLVITAEGIEDVEHYKRLKDGNCDFIQGYLFSKPLNVEDTQKIYSENLLHRISTQPFEF